MKVAVEGMKYTHQLNKAEMLIKTRMEYSLLFEKIKRNHMYKIYKEKLYLDFTDALD